MQRNDDWLDDGSSDDDDEEEEEEPVAPPPAPVAGPGNNANADANPAEPIEQNAGDNNNEAAPNPAQPAQPGPPAPAQRPYIVHRTKLCPACRAEITRRPVQAYIVKDLIRIVEGVEQQAELDPWKGIFPPERRRIPRNQDLNDGFLADDDDDGPDWGMVDILGVYPQLPVFPIPAHHVGPAPPVFHDEEDRVMRCGFCLHELLEGHCTNEECRAFYEDEDDYSDGGDVVGQDDGGSHSDGGDSDDDDDDNPDWIGAGGGHGPQLYDSDDDDSFIDDAPIPPRTGSSSPLHLPQPSSELESLPVATREDPIVLSSDGENAPGPSNRRRGRGRARAAPIVVSDDESLEAPGSEAGYVLTFAL